VAPKIRGSPPGSKNGPAVAWTESGIPHTDTAMRPSIECESAPEEGPPGIRGPGLRVESLTLILS